MNLNQVLLAGTLTKDVSLLTATSGKKYCRLAIAINKSVLDKTTGEWKKMADYISVPLWEKDAENAAKYCKKGTEVMVECQLGTRKRELEDGKTDWVLQLTAKRFQWSWGSISGDGRGNMDSPVEGAPFKSENKQDKDDIPYDDELPF